MFNFDRPSSMNGARWGGGAREGGVGGGKWRPLTLGNVHRKPNAPSEYVVSVRKTSGRGTRVVRGPPTASVHLM